MDKMPDPQKKYLELDAFELGQIWGAIGYSKNNLTEALRKKIDLAVTQVYIDSGLVPTVPVKEEKELPPKASR